MSPSPALESADDPGWRSRIDISDTHTFGEDRMISTVVTPRDGLVISRVVGIVMLAMLTFSFGDGTTSVTIGACLLGIAAAQPLIAILWPRADAFRQAQLFSDLAAFVAFAVIAPEYYWLTVVIVAAVLGNHAVMASLRHYVPAAATAIVCVGVLGAWNDIEHFERATGVVAIVAMGLGYSGYKTRAITVSARRDLLSAVSAVGGLAYLVDLHDDRGVVDVVGDVERVLGWTREEWVDADHRALIHPDDFDDYWVDIDAVAVGTLIDRVGRIRTRDGRWIWLRDMSRVVMIGNRKHLRGFAIDVTAQQDGLSQMTAEASTDALTNLRNRRWLVSELSRRESEPGYYLVLTDLNGFKDVNDTLGHDAGDELLQTVAERLTSCLRSGDVLARLGGDEFAIIMHDMPDVSAVVASVDRIAWEVSRPVEISGVSLTTSISAGIALAVPGECSPSEMLRRADTAMYSAKRNRRTSARFDAHLAERTSRRAALSTRLPTALSSRELVLFYQPIIDVATGRIAGTEGLARWQHDTYGLLKPSSFLEVVLLSERAGDFTRAMVADAIDAARRLADAGFHIPVAVNLPIRTVEDWDFEHWFMETCAQASVSPERFVFEIAERDIHDSTSITRSIDRLAALGVTIAIDDFGAGHATFERLRWRNVEQLKLDRSVLRHATTDPRERSILRTVLSLAGELGYDVVAEGIERPDQLELLRELGCSSAQGFLFGEAEPLGDLLDRLQAGSLAAGDDATL